jgi:hypothetical protein
MITAHDRVEMSEKIASSHSELTNVKVHFGGPRSLTFFSVSRYLLIAIEEDPVRSLRAMMASLMRVIVAIVGWTVISQVAEKFTLCDFDFEDEMPGFLRRRTRRRICTSPTAIVNNWPFP